MSYSGTTASSTLSNPPRRIGGAIAPSTVNTSSGLGGCSLWMYQTSDESTNLQSTGYFTDGRLLGMKSGDILMASISSGSSVGLCIGVIACATATTNYACWIATTGAAISSSR